MKNINNKTLRRLLIRLQACREAIDWLGDRDLHTAIAECEHADWMLWLAAQMINRKGWLTHQEVVWLACQCARTALRHIPKGEDRPRIAIETAERWTQGKASIKEVREAVSAAYAAAHAAEAASAAYAASAAAHAAYAVSAARYAADAVSAARYAAEAAAHRDMCAIIRRYLQDKEAR
jgi:hypothetical protein